MGIGSMDVKDLKNLKLNTKASKPVKIPSKKGINLARKDDEAKKKKTTIILASIAVVVLAVVVKFGVVDLLVELNAAKSAYDEVHVQKVALEESLADYNEVLLEYRTYSMDWLDNDTSGRYVSVSRRSVLDMVETMVMPKGNVSSFSVSGDNLSISMSGLNLKQISLLCQELETVDFVKSATVNSASTSGGKTGDENADISGALSFSIQVVLQKPVEEE